MNSLKGKVKFMSRVKEINKFKKLAKVLDTILKIGYWASIILLCFIVTVAIILNFIPKSVVDEAFLNSRSISISFGTLGFDINSAMVSSAQIIKTANLILIPGLIAFIITIFIIIQLRHILKNVLNETPFSLDCVSHMKKLGYGVIASGVIFSIASGIIDYLLIQLFNVEQLLMSTNYINNVKITLTPINVAIVIVGLLLLLLATVFQYGTYLQEEYDSTL